MSFFLERLHGVAQGSKAGPLIFIFVTMVNFALLKSAVGYADDTSNSNSLVAGLNLDSKVIVSLSKELGLVLNPAKTQCIIFGSVADSGDPIIVDGVTITPAVKISILGFTLDSKLQPQVYLKELTDGALYRKNVVGRLSAHLPSHVLKMFARATVLGKIRTYIHLSLKVRLYESDPITVWGKKSSSMTLPGLWAGKGDQSTSGSRIYSKRLGSKQLTRWSAQIRQCWRGERASPIAPSTVSSRACSQKIRAQGVAQPASLSSQHPTPETWPSGTWRRHGIPSRISG